jgi:hypothetical protein
MPSRKEAAKKAVKKRAGHNHDKHLQVEALRGAVEPSAADAIGPLGKLAQKDVKAGRNKNAADRLSTSEHLNFAVLGADS